MVTVAPTPLAAFPGPATAGDSGLQSIADVVAEVTPWVASITVRSLQRGLFTSFENAGDGSGIVVRPDGYIVTNNHVVAGATEIIVNLPSGHSYEGRVVGRDEVTDLAIVKIDAEDLPAAVFSKDDSLRVGDWVISIGNALALKGGPTVTLGIVSALGRSIQTQGSPGSFSNMIQTDAAINSGNSGGPLINLKGEVVGVNQAIVRQAEGVGFANSASVVVPVIESLIEHGRVVRPLIGFSGQNLTPAIANRLNLNVTEGVIITSISRDGPAYRAGIRAGDVVTKIDDIPIPDVASWLNLLWSYNVGDQIRVEYAHSNETLVTTVVLGERPP